MTHQKKPLYSYSVQHSIFNTQGLYVSCFHQNFTLLLRVFLPLADDGALHGFAVELPVVVYFDGPDRVAPLHEHDLALKQQRVFTWEQT